jgi:hypothetical protein
VVGRDVRSGVAPALGWAVMIGGFLGRGLGSGDLVAGESSCKSCGRAHLVVDLSASGLCDNCLDFAFSASGARMAGSRFWGPGDCPVCQVSREPATGSGARS